MTRILFPALALGLLSTATAFAAPTADFVSQEGKWSLNVKASHHAAGDPIAKDSQIEASKDDGKALQFTQSLTTQKGEKLSVKFDGAYDGKMYSMRNGSSMMYQHISANAYRDAGKRLDGGSWKETCTFSQDHTKLTCEGADLTANGKSFPYVEVWEKS